MFRFGYLDNMLPSLSASFHCCDKGIKDLHSIYSNKSCKVFPPIEFLEFIWDNLFKRSRK